MDMSESSTRPVTARAESHRVPGSFNNEEHELPPLEDSDHDFHNDSVFANSSLPPLPPGDSSLLHAPSHPGSHGTDPTAEAMDEREMRKQLMDIESSFLPEPSVLGQTQGPGADDSLLFGNHSSMGQNARFRKNNNKFFAGGEEETIEEEPYGDYEGQPTPPGRYKTPGLISEHVSNLDLSEPVVNKSSLESMSSSPTAAAAARTISRAVSMATIGGYETADDRSQRTSSQDEKSHHSDEDGAEESTPRKKRVENSDQALQAPPPSMKLTTNHLGTGDEYDAEGEEKGLAPPSAGSGRRPAYLRSRQASQRSSASSYTNFSADNASDVTLGADYALQSGGAVPATTSHARHSIELSRSISLGSIASGISNLGEHAERDRTASGGSNATALHAGTGESGLPRLEEGPESTAADDIGGDEPSDFKTPKAGNRAFIAPTDTVIARHVRNVHVPDSVAREYHHNHRPPSPEKRAVKTGPLPRKGAKNLTLKEQSSTIDKLSKENFDLKLKIWALETALDKRSEEGIKEMVSENVELKAGYATTQKEMKGLKRQIRDLEKQLKEANEGKSSTREGSEVDGSAMSPSNEDAQQMEETIVYLRERVESYEVEIERLRNASVAKEGEKRKLAEMVSVLSDRRSGGSDVAAREVADSWRDLLEAETERREIADEENRKLREEVWQLKSEALSASGNVQNRSHQASRSLSGGSEHGYARSDTFANPSEALVQQLKQENQGLRGQLLSQTSMLTSRNREKERLYQEIEDLKLGRLQGEGTRSIAGDSILERSASRAHDRSLSRASGATRKSQMSDVERDDYERRGDALRDQVAGLKMDSQQLNRELEQCLNELEQKESENQQYADQILQFEADLDEMDQDLQTMQKERDEALAAFEVRDAEFEDLKEEAQQNIDSLEEEADQKDAEIQQLRIDLENTTENFSALQANMKSLGESLLKLEDDQISNVREHQSLSQALDQARAELSAAKKSLTEANGKVERLMVEQESSQARIAFLNEEQDGDKIRIGDLQAAITRAETSLLDEKERARDLEKRLAGERHQREVIGSHEKQEVQKMMNDLNRQISAAKDESRRLKKGLLQREAEASDWRSRLTELEHALRQTLGDVGGTKSSLIKSVQNLQNALDITAAQLDDTRSTLAEKDNSLKSREALLESASLESRRLADLLDKERVAHRASTHHFSQLQKTSQQTSRFLSQQSAKLKELESARAADTRKQHQQENHLQSQLLERNTLLLALWNRLSTLCGTDWIHKNSLINGRALPTVDVIATSLAPFAKNLLQALKTVEALVTAFNARIRAVERDLTRDYATLEHNLDSRIKRLDRLDALVASGRATAASTSSEVAKLRGENKLLKAELNVLHRQEAQARAGRNNPPPGPPAPADSQPQEVQQQQPSQLDSTSTTSASNKEAATTSTRAVSTALSRRPSTTASAVEAPANGASPTDASEQRWILRLRELERRLKAEREARLLDRSGARKRLEEGRAENEELKAELEREKVRKGE